MSYPPATKRAALLRATRTAEPSRSTVVVAPAALLLGSERPRVVDGLERRAGGVHRVLHGLLPQELLAPPAVDGVVAISGPLLDGVGAGLAMGLVQRCIPGCLC